MLIDDMEFLQGPTIQQEFCHTLNSLIDGGRQVVVAADRGRPSSTSSTCACARVLAGVSWPRSAPWSTSFATRSCRSGAEACAETRGLNVSDTVLAFLAERLTESGRELEGAVIACARATSSPPSR